MFSKNIYVWKSKSWIKIYLQYMWSNTIQHKKFILYRHHKFLILKEEKIKTWIFQVDENITLDHNLYFDVWDIEIDIEYRWMWIATKIYTKINKILYKNLQKTLYSDRTSISLSASLVWENLIKQWKAEFLWYNSIWETYFDSKRAPTPMYKMKMP